MGGLQGNVHPPLRRKVDMQLTSVSFLSFFFLFFILRIPDGRGNGSREGGVGMGVDMGLSAFGVMYYVWGGGD